MSTEEIIDRIKAIGFMKAIDSQLQNKVIDLFRTCSQGSTVKAGTPLFREGEATTNEGILFLSGTVLIRKANAPEMEAHAPDLLGEMGQFNPANKRTATVLAQSDLKVLRFDWKVFYEGAEQKLSQAERGKLSQALQEHAWKHFTE
ncbi:MAG: cyclic nucleotide-binding domain-containing protein [Candidatus Hydrogenedentes bacterium]|nr:cyclic nucleotide-binding domain-containing protein [Candidatus Hydrogenedentota bacterium]